MASTVVQNPGQVNNAGDRLAIFLKVFSGEVLTAFERTTVTMNRHVTRSISSGKSAQFPASGRAVAKYLAPGSSLDDQRSAIPHNEVTIVIDGLLTSDCLITDLDAAMSHVDYRNEYSRQLGEALAVAADGAVLAEAVAVSQQPERLPGLGSGGSKQLATVTDVSAPSVQLGKEVLDALAIQRANFTTNRVPAADRYFFCTPNVFSSIGMALTSNNANFAMILDPSTGNLKGIHGFEIIEVPHFEDGGAETKHAFPSALKGKVAGLCMHRSAVGTVKLKDLALERGRRIEFQGDQIVAKYAMGHGGLRAESASLIIAKTA